MRVSLRASNFLEIDTYISARFMNSCIIINSRSISGENPENKIVLQYYATALLISKRPRSHNWGEGRVT